VPFRKHSRTACAFCLAGLSLAATLVLSQGVPTDQNWTNYVRIGAYGLEKASAEKIVADATADKVFGIEIDNDIPGR